ncbi:MAG: adenosine-specific kinase [Anaerolineaceae bacterium]|nr:adenosine-specific kinase [Anaerolineaceae bacterium]
MEILQVKIDKTDEIGFILGQAHLIKTVEDLHEALVTCVPGIQFGLAFCEASGMCLVRFSGTNNGLVERAKKTAMDISAGHSFVIFLGEGFWPVNVLNAIKAVPEVAVVFCATHNPVEVIVADDGSGRGILGVIEGEKPKGIEGDADISWRKELLRKIGYKQ